MSSMPFETEQTSYEHVGQVMRARMFQNAVVHYGDNLMGLIDSFSATILEEHGLLTVKGDLPPADIISRVLSDPNSSLRMTAPAGPLLFIKEDKGVSVLDIYDLLADPRSEVRAATIRYLEDLPTETLARRTRQQIADLRSRIVSDDRAEWFSAAKVVFDRIRTDIYLTFSGFQQSYTLNFNEGVKRFVSQLLRPSSALLTSVDLDIWNPSDDKESALAFVRQLTNEETLQQSINRYYQQLGHIPLTGDAGLGSLIRAWAKKEPTTNMWDQLWEWADSRQSPIARYHACVAFLTNHDLVPQDLDGFLWEEIGDLVNAYPDGSTRTRWQEAWTIREELSLHYGNYLECLLPGLPSERLMIMGWWLTERFCELLPQSPGILKKIRELTINNELRRSAFMNHVTHPAVTRSSLRYITRLVQGMWSASVLCEAGKANELLNRSRPAELQRQGIDARLRSLVNEGYPPVLAATDRPTFSFELAVAPFIRMWNKAYGDSVYNQSSESSDMIVAVADTQFTSSLPNLIEVLSQGEEKKHVYYAHVLRQLAYLNANTGPILWELLHKDDQWLILLRKVTKDALGIFFEALTELQAQEGGPWRPALCHMFAAAAEEADNPERRQLLFGLTLFSCLHAGVSSAVERLMHGHVRGDFAKFVSEWRKQLLRLCEASTPWVAGRVRAALPSLVLDEIPRDEDW